jgi:NADPH:quinone reductase-like Zn-dependent oxidoreductase
MTAALGQAGNTVWTALEWRAILQPGESVLILGTTGATGQLAIQAARLQGAGRVVAAGRDPKMLLVHSNSGRMQPSIPDAIGLWMR